ncbi:hypothetical protein OPQ81_003974 [Rhizoctonia solani]|nr:hypothetical protein OPQ81_003974 [Rhizoctonia solani]
MPIVTNDGINEHTVNEPRISSLEQVCSAYFCLTPPLTSPKKQPEISTSPSMLPGDDNHLDSLSAIPIPSFTQVDLPGPYTHNLSTLPAINQKSFVLDAFQSTPVPQAPIPHMPIDTLATANTYPRPQVSASLPTDEEILELAAAAMAEDMAGMTLDNYASIDFDLLNFPNNDTTLMDPSQLELLDQATQSIIADLTNKTVEPSGMLSSNHLSSYGLTSLSHYAHIDPNELTKMWNELGTSLKNWFGQVPGAMDFSEEDMMRMLMDFDALDTTCSPSYMILDKTWTPIPVPAIPNPVLEAQSTRKIKNLPLRRIGTENHAQAVC